MLSPFIDKVDFSAASNGELWVQLGMAKDRLAVQLLLVNEEGNDSQMAVADAFIATAMSSKP